MKLANKYIQRVATIVATEHSAYMQQTSDELRKLITQLSSRVYSLQAVASKFRLTAAENYHERLHSRIMEIYPKHVIVLSSLQRGGFDGLYIDMSFRHYDNTFYIVLYRMDYIVSRHKNR